MKICIVSGNPKRDGLCQSIIDAARLGAIDNGAEIDEIRLGDYPLLRCQVCGGGWGTCRNDHYCTYGDDGFDALKARVEAADALILATPVYWSETAETLKCFLDRLRRCNFSGPQPLRGKQTLLVASAGGSGNGLLTCLEQLDRFCRHVGATIFDTVGINRWNSDYKRIAVRAAAQAMAGGRINGETI